MGEEDEDEDAGYSLSALSREMRWVSAAHKPLITPGMIADFEAICDLVMADEETTKFIFGDDSEITATADGVDVSEHDHD